jgi:large subunit ribosomal protein L15e
MSSKNQNVNFKFASLRELRKKKQKDGMHFILHPGGWEYRQLPELVRVPHPRRPDRALGYRAKQGFVICPIRIRKGNHRRVASKNRLYGKNGREHIHTLTVKPDLQALAENKAEKTPPSLRLFDSYYLMLGEPLVLPLSLTT